MASRARYGSWADYAGAPTVEDTIRRALGDYAADYDLEALAGAYRAAINSNLIGITLSGNEFVAGADLRMGDAEQAIRRVLVELDEEGVFWDLAARHDISGRD